MSQTLCPLCKKNNFYELQKFDSSSLEQKFQHKFNVSIKQYIVSDIIRTLLCLSCELEFFEGIKAGDLKFYEALSKKNDYYSDKQEFEYAALQIFSKNVSRVLDFGSGCGDFLSKLRSDKELKAHEINPHAIKSLQEKNIKLDRPEDLYDFILAIQVIEHLEDPASFLQQVKDKLLPNGYLFITVPNLSRPALNEFNLLDFPPHHITRWSKNSLKKIGEIYELEFIEFYEEKNNMFALAAELHRRRLALVGNSFFSKLVLKFGQFLDAMLLPYKNDSLIHSQTHGALFKNRP